MQIASEPAWEMGFSEADNKGVSGLRSWKERPLYLPSNCSLLDSAYISTTFASSAVSQTKAFKGMQIYANEVAMGFVVVKPW